MTKLKKCGKIALISALDNTSSGEDGTEILRKEFDNVIRFPFPPNVKDVGEMDNFSLMQAKTELAYEIEKMRKG